MIETLDEPLFSDSTERLIWRLLSAPVTPAAEAGGLSIAATSGATSWLRKKDWGGVDTSASLYSKAKGAQTLPGGMEE
jgi:hypothetical protein